MTHPPPHNAPNVFARSLPLLKKPMKKSFSFMQTFGHSNRAGSWLQSVSASLSRAIFHEKMDDPSGNDPSGFSSAAPNAPKPEEPEENAIPSNDPDDELLVAYLDGELTPEECNALKKRLEESPKLRLRLDEFRVTGNILETLKTAPSSPQLIQTTLEMVAVDAENQLKKAKHQIKKTKVRYLISFFLGLILFLALGDWILSAMISHFRRQWEHNVPMLILLDQLEVVQDFSFLEQLHQSGLFQHSSQKTNAEAEPEGLFPQRLFSEKEQEFLTRFSATDFFPPLIASSDLASPNHDDFSNLKKEKDDPSNLEKSDAFSLKTAMMPSEADKASHSEGLAFSQVFKPLVQDRKFNRKFLKFTRLNKNEKKKIQQFYHQLINTHNESYFSTLLNYYTWFAIHLHERQQDQIQSTPITNRMSLVRQFYEQESRPQFLLAHKDNAFPMTSANATQEGGGAFAAAALPSFLSSPNNSDRKPAFSDKKTSPGRSTDKWGLGPDNGPRAQHRKKDSLSAQPPFRNRLERLLKIVPRELQQEDVSHLSQQLDAFIKAQTQKGLNLGPRETLDAFVQSLPLAETIQTLSPQGQAFLTPLPQEEQQHMFALLLSVDFFRKVLANTDPSEPNPFFGPPNFLQSYAARNGGPSKPRRGQNEWWAGSNAPSFMKARPQDIGSESFSKMRFPDWTTESTRELAQTLRHLTQKEQDELLSLPSDEMYARLLVIHMSRNSVPKMPPPFSDQGKPSKNAPFDLHPNEFEHSPNAPFNRP